MEKKENIHIAYRLSPIDSNNYEIQALFYDDNNNELDTIKKQVDMKQFNSMLTFSDEEYAIKAKAEEIVKNAMWRTMTTLLEKEITIAAELIKLRQS